jgi:hypothetical protein
LVAAFGHFVGMTLELFFEHRENIVYQRVNYGLKIDRQVGTIAKKILNHRTLRQISCPIGYWPLISQQLITPADDHLHRAGSIT